MAVLLLIGGTAILLAGCTLFQAAVPPAPKTPAQAIYEIKTGLVAAEDVALDFLPKVCPIAATCQDARVIGIVKAMNAADALIGQAETTVRTAPAGGISAAQAIADAQGALDAFRATLVSYGITVPALPAPAA